MNHNTEQEFIPLSAKKYQELTVPETKQIVEINFENSENTPIEWQQLTSEFLRAGYSYIFSILGGDALVGLKNNIKLKKSGRHAALGDDLSLNIEDLQKSNSDSDLGKKYLQQSLVIHEILHHLIDEEDFPMFIEMIYMREKKQDWRIQQLASLYQNQRLPAPYITGLEKIKEWLGADDIESMLSSFHTIDLTDLKKIFREKYVEYCQQDPVLEQQIQKIKDKITLADMIQKPSDSSFESTPQTADFLSFWSAHEQKIRENLLMLFSPSYLEYLQKEGELESSLEEELEKERNFSQKIYDRIVNFAKAGNVDIILLFDLDDTVGKLSPSSNNGSVPMKIRPSLEPLVLELKKLLPSIQIGTLSNRPLEAQKKQITVPDTLGSFSQIGYLFNQELLHTSRGAGIYQVTDEVKKQLQSIFSEFNFDQDLFWTSGEAEKMSRYAEISEAHPESTVILVDDLIPRDLKNQTKLIAVRDCMPTYE